MYRLKSSWRDFSGWMRMQVYPEPCCSCCWELNARPERHACVSMPLRVGVDIVLLPGGTEPGRAPGDGLAEIVRDWLAGEKWKGGVFVAGPGSETWREWAEMAGARLIPLESLAPGPFPAEGRLADVAELSECHVVIREADAGREVPEALDYFTPNGLPVLRRAGAEPIPASALAFSPADLRRLFERSGLDVPADYAPHRGPYGQCKSELPELADFYAAFVAGRAVDSDSYGYLSMLWRFVAARGAA